LVEYCGEEGHGALGDVLGLQ
jgi:hypothetical protein